SRFTDDAADRRGAGGGALGQVRARSLDDRSCRAESFFAEVGLQLRRALFPYPTLFRSLKGVRPAGVGERAVVGDVAAVDREVVRVRGECHRTPERGKAAAAHPAAGNS